VRGRGAKYVSHWLIYELFRGSITAKELDWSEAQIRDFAASRKTSNPYLAVMLKPPDVASPTVVPER
jgi:hypothetical protein